MNTIFMNSENGKTFDHHRLLHNLTVKIDLRWKDKYIALSNLSIYYTYLLVFKKIAMKNLNYLMDHILYQIFKIILNIYLKSKEKKQLILR